MSPSLSLSLSPPLPPSLSPPQRTGRVQDMWEALQAAVEKRRLTMMGGDAPSISIVAARRDAAAGLVLGEGSEGGGRGRKQRVEGEAGREKGRVMEVILISSAESREDVAWAAKLFCRAVVAGNKWEGIGERGRVLV